MNDDNVNQTNIRDVKEGIVEPRDEVAQPPALMQIAAGEIEQQIATARRYPRAVKEFRDQAMSLACLNQQVAEECLFALRRESRDGEVTVIEGPSIRLAEIVAYAWGNCRIGSRIVHEGEDTVVVQGVFQDVQRNIITYSEVARGIMTSAKYGRTARRYSRDMITVTTNAAQSIARRNAIMSGVPRALWWDVYQAARKVAAGDAKSLSAKRQEAVKSFAVWGITEAQILAGLKRDSMEEVTRDDVLQLLGIFRAIKDEEVLPENAFPASAKSGIDLRRGNGIETVANDHVEGDVVKEGTTEAMSVKPKPPTQTAAPAGIPPPDEQVGAPAVTDKQAEVPTEPTAIIPPDQNRPRRRRGAVE